MHDGALPHIRRRGDRLQVRAIPGERERDCSGGERWRSRLVHRVQCDVCRTAAPRTDARQRVECTAYVISKVKASVADAEQISGCDCRTVVTRTGWDTPPTTTRAWRSSTLGRFRPSRARPARGTPRCVPFSSSPSTNIVQSSLDAALGEILLARLPSNVRTLDFSSPMDDGDHHDHHVTARIARGAVEAHLPNATLTGYFPFLLRRTALIGRADTRDTPSPISLATLQAPIWSGSSRPSLRTRHSTRRSASL